MKKSFLLLGILSTAFISVWAAPVALVYENEQAVKDGRAILAPLSDEGAVVSAKLALASASTLLIGRPGEELFKAALIRLDNELDVALVRPADRVSDTALQQSYQAKSARISAFLPAAAAVAPLSSNLVPAPVTPAPSGPFMIRINGTDISHGTIELKSTFRKSPFNLEMVYVSSVSAWSYSLDLVSAPKLSFWKQGKRMGLNDVPSPAFHYDHQAMFVPMKAGSVEKLGIEAHFMDAGVEYEWTFKIKTKQESQELKARVRFK